MSVSFCDQIVSRFLNKAKSTYETPIVEHSEPITLIGGGDVGENDLNLASSVAPTLVAADGGADLAVAQGHMPQAVIGDFDSVSDDVQRLVPPERLFPVREQETTDFDKALRHIHAPLVVGVGFLGGRVDHQLAVLNTLVRRAATPCVLLGAHEVLFHAPPGLSWHWIQAAWCHCFRWRA